MIREKLYLECSCSSDEHTLRFTLWRSEFDDTQEVEIFAHVFLNDRPLLGRIKNAIKYIFGYKCRYGHWDEFITNDPEEVKRLRDMCNKFLELSDETLPKELNKNRKIRLGGEE